MRRQLLRSRSGSPVVGHSHFDQFSLIGIFTLVSIILLCFFLLTITILFLQLINLNEREVLLDSSHGKSGEKNSGKIPANLFYGYLPHLLDQRPFDHGKWLDPEIIIGRSSPYSKRTDLLNKDGLLIVVPSSFRHEDGELMKNGKKTSLLKALESLTRNLSSISYENLVNIHIVVIINEVDRLNAEIENYWTETIKRILKQIPIGLLEVIVPPMEWYPPDLYNVKWTSDDLSLQKIANTRQNLDYAYAMLYARYFHPHTRYYLQLEDSVVAVQDYAPILELLVSGDQKWRVFDLGQNLGNGMVGKMFRVRNTTDGHSIFSLFHQIMLFHRGRPIEWIFNDWLVIWNIPKEKPEKNCIPPNCGSEDHDAYRMYPEPIFYRQSEQSESKPSTSATLEPSSHVFVEETTTATLKVSFAEERRRKLIMKVLMNALKEWEKIYQQN